MKLQHSAYSIICLIVITILSTACQSGQTSLPGRLKLAGSTTIEPAARAVAEDFMRQFPDVEISVRGGGSTYGIKGIAYGGLHIAMTSRELQDSELEKWPTLTATPVGHDGVAVVVSRTLYDQGVTQLTLEEVMGIWRGEITNWQELGGPDLPVWAYDRGADSGTQATFIEIALSGEAEPSSGIASTIVDSEDVISVVTQQPGAVSILSAGLQANDVVGLAIVAEDGQAVVPSAENVGTGHYPIVRNLNLITAGPPQGLAAQFVTFMLSPQGQNFVESGGFSRVVQ